MNRTRQKSEPLPTPTTHDEAHGQRQPNAHDAEQSDIDATRAAKLPPLHAPRHPRETALSANERSIHAAIAQLQPSQYGPTDAEPPEKHSLVR